ncbi:MULTISPECIES: molybdopterin-dependent oxidoreductase [Bacillaceae]|uniref:molybdopterin-dependent oxidoreductase n=1 Tax=Bacillaceae TaxID=186817 RepID=UPI000BFCB275|nr:MULTISPECIES: molybdopterin-dependent oxidoreductase [Bacillaceae]PGT82504.1 oxidoreductase [Bacillus sp. AFS040349]UGB31000.1 molybdopterin-dependent oxidoreductase [Metabacillus sp. B2-18]
MKQVFKSSCPLNCWDSCGFEVTVEDGKVIKVEGDKDHPITKGKICGRGRMLETKTNSKERLTVPLKKVNGVFQEISWKQALDEIAEKMKELKQNFGPASVLHSHDYANNGLLKNLDKRFFNSFGGATSLVGSICWGSGIEAQIWDFGSSDSHAPDDIFHSKHIVIWGRNVARTNMHLFQQLQDAKKRGSTITVIDPIYNATAKISDHYISIKPGMDGLVAIGVMKYLISENKQDAEFIKNYTVGYEDLILLLNHFTLEGILEQAEISFDDIKYIAELYVNGPTTTYLGLGMQRYSNGGNTIRLIDALVAISGNVGIPGGGANFGNIQVGKNFNMQALTLPEKATSTRTFSMMKQADGVLEAMDPEIKMIIVTCGNPLVQVPDSNKIIRAFQSVDTVVVIDHFLTDTAELADYVLPTTTVFEEEDIYYASMYHHYVNYGEKLVEPPGEAKSDLWIWTELAERLGFGEEFSYTRGEYLEMATAHLCDKGITLDRLKEEKRVPLPVNHVPWETKKFSTPSGKFEFTSELGFNKGLEGKPQYIYPKESTISNPRLAEKYPYQLLSIHPLRSNHSQHYVLIEGMQTVKIEVSEDIAKEKQLVDGDKVTIFNDRGKLTGDVKILKKAHANTINVDEGQWHKFGGSVNLLTPDDVSDNGQGSTLYDCLVNIKKVD